MHRLPHLLLATAVALALAAPAVAGPPSSAPVFPDVVDLPDGFQPEGIAIGGGPVAYAGSLADGDVVRVDLRTGAVDRVVDRDGGPAVGLDVSPDGDVVYVAGGGTGELRVHDTTTGQDLAVLSLTDPGTFVNDVVATRDAAWLTNSNLAELYRVPLDASGVPTGVVETVPLSGDFELVEGFNANGIDATPAADALYVIQSATGTLYRVDPSTGTATTVDVDGELVNGDGIALAGGHELLVVRNQDNLVTTVRLAPDGLSGTVTAETSDPDFDVPTTVATFGDEAYVVNARFGTPPTPDTPYTLVRVG